MAFPQIVDADTKNGTVTANSASWSLTYPTNLQSGNLILLLAGVDGSVTPTLPAGWITGSSSAGAATIIAAKKLSNGTETGAFTLGLSASEQGAWRVIRLTGWEGTIGTTFLNASASDGSAIGIFASGPPGGTTNASHALIDPVNWGAEDTLWIIAVAFDTSRTVTSFPIDTVDQGSLVSGGSNGATLAWGRRELNATSWDPQNWGMDTSDDWGTVSIAVRPAAVGGGGATEGNPHFIGGGYYG
jgi:hypothetical protein